MLSFARMCLYKGGVLSFMKVFRGVYIYILYIIGVWSFVL